MEDNEGTQTEVINAETNQPPQTEQPPATTEEQMATLQAQLQELQVKYEQADKGLRTAQATLTSKDRQLKEKEDLRGELDTLKQMIKVVATSRSADPLDDDLPKGGDIDKKFRELEEGYKMKEAQRQIAETIDGFQQRVESLGLTEDDDAYLEVQELVLSGTPNAFKRADLRLKKLEKEKSHKEAPPVDEHKPIDEKKRIEELEKEIKRLKQKESGELDSETGLPSGSGDFTFTPEQIDRMRQDGTYEENRTAIWKAYQDGKVKPRQ